MNSHILNSFINAPELKITSEKYPFENFSFLNEMITTSEFNFPEQLVLGMQAEACFEAFLRSSKNYKLLVANLQINGAKETLGELDYIAKNIQSEEIIHIELACKFYLYDENLGATEEEKWIGPNRKDSLFDKLEKVKLKQFPLLQKAETIEKLHSLNITLPTSQQLCLKAFLFIPKKIKSNDFSLNYTNCIVGYWIKHNDFVAEESEALYAIPTKKEWLLPPRAIAAWHSFSEIKEKVELQIKNNKSPLIYKKTPHKMERFFVVWW
ncbi:MULTISPECIES: DUF1853 family protein [Aequorivita]|uniref:DUF1853 family protein n=2 Tax=Aequorivita TaxID=153265 RepID=A0AB35YWN8_9FLAO|nr:DUF1853 family protein [Aequorivita sp. Ant34-E75]WGF91226.1 DUF1853 family protein [Aequorivita sp. Ant34-E75]